MEAPQSPNPAPSSPQPQPASQAPLAAQVVEAIPVHQPGQVASTAPIPINPIAGDGPSVVHSQQADDDLDRILQSVNNRTKAAQIKPPKKSVLPTQKLSATAGSLKGIFKNKTPIGLTLLAAVVAVGLSLAAVAAYRENNKTQLSKIPSTVGTSSAASDSIQQAGGSLVRPADVDNYADGLQSKLNSLNDSGDFDSTSLSDQSLGL
ncbi:MAG TPA: hypothetical protein VMT23_02670 [Candidatus Binatia bacterium]|nr:hypothetical protein [Candidatus Binatia bacterium]